MVMRHRWNTMKPRVHYSLSKNTALCDTTGQQ